MRWPLVWRSALNAMKKDRDGLLVERNDASRLMAKATDALERRDEVIKHIEAKAEQAAARAGRSDEIADSTVRAFQDLQSAWRRDGERHEQEMVRAETRYADLMVSYRMLRLQGFTPAPAEPVAREVEKPDPVLAAINAVARDSKTRAAAIRQVEIDRAAKLTDVEIIQRIQRGNRPAEEIT